MSLFYLFTDLGMVRWSPNLPYAHKLTKLSDDVAFEVGPSITLELGQCSKDQDVSLPQKLSNSFTVWLGVTYAITCFVKWSQKTFGGWSNSVMVSMLLKSTCSHSKGVVTTMGYMGALAWMPSCWMHYSHLVIAFCIWVAMPGHQNQSCSKHNVQCWPWCPASGWHPFMAATQWALGTRNCKTSSISPASVCQW